MNPGNWPLLAALALAVPASAESIVAEPALSADAAIEVARGALAECRKDGQKVSVTVVDQAGRPKVTLRDDGAAPHTAEHSFRKAYTALTYRMPSADYGKRVAENKGGIGPQLLANITSAAGGVPIKSGTATIGAVGVSGTPSSAGGGAGDAKCGEAGIARIAKDLAPK
jgi:uncharacterized protein GlcG (DUF336 family)